MMKLTARFLTNDDLKPLDRFLEPHTAEAFFLRSNARRAGLTWSGKPFEGQYIGVFDDVGMFKAVITYTWINTITAYAQNAEDLALAIPLLKNCINERSGKIEAICAMKSEGDYITDALGLPQTASRRDDTEFLYKLSFPDLRSNMNYSFEALIRLADHRDLDTLCAWRRAFNIEALNAKDDEELKRKVHDEITSKTAAHELYVLELNQTKEIVSFMGISGSVPEHAHIGPVYTPPEHRGYGYAKALVVGSLEAVNQTRGGVVKTSGLFTANPSAIKVYETVGFREAGAFRLNLLHEDFRYPSTML